MINKNLTQFRENFNEANPIRPNSSLDEMLAEVHEEAQSFFDNAENEDEESEADIEASEMFDDFFFGGGLYSSTETGRLISVTEEKERIIAEIRNDGKELLSAYEEGLGVKYSVDSEVKAEEDKQNLKMIIDDVSFVLKESTKESGALYGSETPVHVRKYTNKARMEKVMYRKPVTLISTWKKVLFFIFVGFCFAVFLALKSNAYYVFMNGNVMTIFSCAFMWLLEDNAPFVVNPLYIDVFLPALLTWTIILAMIGLVIYIDADQRSQSRVGHEHGRARLGTDRDFKKFKQSFRDSMTKNNY